MELVVLIVTFIGAYTLFMFVAYHLAKLLFPSLPVDDEREIKPKRVRSRQNANRRVSVRALR
jgi:hypothetical protein